MARTEARLSVEIWNDPDFRALSAGGQRLYMFLISQADLHHIGLIGLRLRRWSQASAGLTVADVESGLVELEASRFVVIDWDAEELLIRSFIRGDKVYRQAQVLSVAAEQVSLVTSLALRVALRVELGRIATLEMNANCAALIARMLEQLADTVLQPVPNRQDVSAGGEGGRHPARQPESEGGEQALGVRGVSTTVTTDAPNPDPLDPVPDPQSTLSADALPITLPAQEPAPKRPTKRDVDAAFARFWDVYPRKVSKGDAEKVFVRVAKSDVDLETVIAGAVAYRNDRGRQRAEIKFTKHPATWLNGQCWLDEPAKENPRASPNGHQPYRNPEDSSGYYGDL